jgi:hypothetical protein
VCSVRAVDGDGRHCADSRFGFNLEIGALTTTIQILRGERRKMRREAPEKIPLEQSSFSDGIFSIALRDF